MVATDQNEAESIHSTPTCSTCRRVIWLLLIGGLLTFSILLPDLYTPSKPSLDTGLGTALRRFLVGFAQSEIQRHILGQVQAFSLATLVVLSIPSRQTASGRPRRALSVAVGFLAVCLLIVLREEGMPQEPVTLLALFAGGIGMWIGAAVRTGAKTWPAILIGGVLMTGIDLAAGIVGIRLATDEVPVAFQALRSSADENRSVVESLGKTWLLSGRSDATRRIELSQADLNTLLQSRIVTSWQNCRIAVILGEDSFLVRASVPAGRLLGERRYLNVQASGRLQITDGSLRLELLELHSGQLEIAAAPRARLARAIEDFLQETRQMRQALKTIDAMRIQDGVLLVEGTPLKTGGPALAAILGASEIGPALRSRTAIHLEYMLEWIDARPGRDMIPFEQFLETSLLFAWENSQDADPVFETRAALLAIGIAVGDSDLSQLVGIDLDDDALASIHRIGKRVRLRDRRDLSQHFAISAAITATFSNDSLIDFLGEFKEEMIDAEIGGRGFSFSDLMANQAGARFAKNVMANEQNARAVHRRAQAGIPVGDFFPAPNGLPDGISREELLGTYGGINGKRYNEVLEEIHRRLATAPLLSDGG